MKELNGAELAGYIKERQAHEVRSLRAKGHIPKLLILLDNDSPVIGKYVSLKKRYGEDIGVIVEEKVVETKSLASEVEHANEDKSISGIIVQLPINNPEKTDEIVKKISPEKDVDGLSGSGHFDSATATAINWLLTGYSIDLSGKKVAIVGRGRLVGTPLEKMWRASGVSVEAFEKDDGNDLGIALPDFDVVVTATGSPRIIKSDMLRPGAVVVDAGTASEGGMLVGDVDDAVRERNDITITPKIGGVGPLTIAVLFDNVIAAAKKKS